MLTQADTNKFENAGLPVAAAQHTRVHVNKAYKHEYVHIHAHMYLCLRVTGRGTATHTHTSMHAQRYNTLKDAQIHTVHTPGMQYKEQLKGRGKRLLCSTVQGLQ